MAGQDHVALIAGAFPRADHVLAFNDRWCCNCVYGGDDGMQCPAFLAGYDSWLTREMPDCIKPDLSCTAYRAAQAEGA